MRVPKLFPWILTAMGILFVIAGAMTWTVSVRLERGRVISEAHRLFEDLGTEEQESPRDASTLVELSQSTRAIRAAFLSESLNSETAANKLRIHEQALSVALSRISYAEAIALYQTAILPALKANRGPNVMRECFAMLSRWSLVAQISPRDADDIASRLTDQLASASEDATETTPLAQFSGAVAELAPRLSPDTAASLADKLFVRATTERDPAIIQTETRSLIALAPRLSANTRSKFAFELVNRLTTERDPSILLALAPALAPMSATLDAAAAGVLAEKLASRITNEFTAESLDALGSAFASVAPNADTAATERISEKLLRHVMLEPDPSVLLLQTQLLAAFGKKLPQGVYEQAAGSLLERIKAKPSAGTLSVLAFCLGVFKDRATGDKFFAEAASEIVSRFATEHNMEGLSGLASAIDSVADLLEPVEAERLSSLLVNRMFEERDPGSLLYIAVGLESIADEARGPGAAALVVRLSERMREEHSPHVLRSLAFSAGAFKNASANVDAGAEVLIGRMEEENDPELLRDLTSGLYALRDKAGNRWFEKAASILADRIQTQLNPGAIRVLITSLHALAAKVGPEPFERAASAIVANANNLAALEPGLQRIAGTLRPAKAQELTRILEQRIEREQDPKMLRTLGLALADLPVDTSKVDVRRVLSIPQAPCKLSRSPGQLFNPLCSESSWNELAAAAVHAKANPVNDDIEPDFTQLAPDDDDDATDTSVDAQALDFHQLSDAVSGLRPSEREAGATTQWPSITLVIMGAAALGFSAMTRRAQSL